MVKTRYSPPLKERFPGKNDSERRWALDRIKMLDEGIPYVNSLESRYVRLLAKSPNLTIQEICDRLGTKYRPKGDSAVVRKVRELKNRKILSCKRRYTNKPGQPPFEYFLHPVYRNRLKELSPHLFSLGGT